MLVINTLVSSLTVKLPPLNISQPSAKTFKTALPSDSVTKTPLMVVATLELARIVATKNVQPKNQLLVILVLLKLKNNDSLTT